MADIPTMPTTIPTNFLPPPPPPGLNYIAAINPSLTLLMIGTVWSAMLIPLLIVLLLFSNPGLRRQPIFILNFIAVLAGIVLGIINIYLEVTAIVSPLTPVKASVYIGFVALILYLPVLMDTILIVRLVVVYPPRMISWPRRLAVFGPPLIFKILRVANLMVFIIKWTKLFKDYPNPILAGQALWGSDEPWTRIEWFSQVFDNCYASVLFILRLQEGRSLNDTNGSVSMGKIASHGSRLRSLFFIALGNFVFPCLLSLVQLIFLYRGRQFLDGTYVFLTNCHVEIIGVLLATIWVAGGHWSEQQNSATRATDMRYHQQHKVRIQGHGASPVPNSSGDKSTVITEDLELGSFRAAPGKYNGSEHRNMY
ncbi:hypothetical protein DFH09DRAFT_1103559 [Mycena vulgaris]|nr:hypothetical protein DFH09DRAFT_1103559 [Mycena vulgaris]